MPVYDSCAIVNVWSCPSVISRVRRILSRCTYISIYHVHAKLSLASMKLGLHRATHERRKRACCSLHVRLLC